MILIYIIHNIKKLRGDVMKKSICIFALFAVFCVSGCYQDENITGHEVRMVVTGNCAVVRIDTNYTADYEYYYELDESVDYESENDDGFKDGQSREYYIDVHKHTGDATTVTATIYVDGAQVATQTTTAAYGHIRVEYTLQN